MYKTICFAFQTAVSIVREGALRDEPKWVAAKDTTYMYLTQLPLYSFS